MHVTCDFDNHLQLLVHFLLVTSLFAVSIEDVGGTSLESGPSKCGS